MNNQTQNNVNFVANLILKILLAIAAIALLLYSAGGGLFTSSLFSFKRNKPALTVERSPVTVQEIRAVGKLVTASYYDEFIIKRTKNQLVETNDGDKSGEIVIIQQAHARLGIDLAKLKDKDVVVQGDTSIQITLPPVECLHLIMNPSDTFIYSEPTGAKAWSFEQVKEVMKSVKTELMNDVAGSKAMEKAHQGAETILKEFLTACGYKNVYIVHTPPEIKVPQTETPQPTTNK